MAKIRKHEFEDQSIVDFSLNQQEIKITIECWNEDTDETKNVFVTFNNVRNIQIDSAPNSNISMLSEEGDIIHFEIDGNAVLLIVIWYDWVAKTNTTKSYKFDFGDRRITPGVW